MKKIIGVVVGILFFSVSSIVWAEGDKGGGVRHQQKEKVQAHRQAQKAENKEFRAGLKDMKPEEKKAAVSVHRQQQYQENTAFRQQLHSENMSFLKEKLANNKKLTDAQKEDLINSFESQYQENMNYREQKHSENVAFFEKIANDPNMTQEQKKEAIKAHRQAQKEAFKARHEEQKNERKAHREKIRSEVKAQADNQSEGTVQ